jgi:hypothetical protein
MNDTMCERQKHIDQLFTAELQFRLASATRLAVTQKIQPLDLPMVWTHGKHRVEYAEIALRQDQADFAACYLHRSATYLMAVAIKDAIRNVVPNPETSTDSDVRAAYQIARLIRNAFAHAPFMPTWSIDPNCKNTVFSIPDLITLDTSGLQGTPFDWRDYGGPLALFRLCKFVRHNILKDPVKPRSVLPIPDKQFYQQGDLVLTKVDEISPGAVPLEVEPLSDGGTPLGGGHVIYPSGLE